MRPTIREFDAFIRGDFKKQIRKAYEKPEIFCEADLQAFAWLAIRKYLSRFKNDRMRVLNKPFFTFRFFPDIVVFKREKPWVLIELKEKKKLSLGSANQEKSKILKLTKRIRKYQGKYLKRGYLVWVGRYNTSFPREIKKEGARFLFEIPILLDERWTKEQISAWSGKFKPFSKYSCSAVRPRFNSKA